MAASALIFPVTTREATRRRVQVRSRGQATPRLGSVRMASAPVALWSELAQPAKRLHWLHLPIPRLLMCTAPPAAHFSPLQEVLAGLADLSEAVLLEFVNGEGEEPPEVAVPVAPSFGAASGQGTPRAASTPRRRRTTTSIPVTPLSVSEAYEVAIAAGARSSQEREERRLEERREARLSLERRQSGGSGVPSQADPESPGRAMSPFNPSGWRSPAALMRRAFAVTPRGSRDRSRSTEGDGRTPHAAVLSPTAGAGQAGAAVGDRQAFADVELVPVEQLKAAAADGGIPLPRAPRSQSSPAAILAGSGSTAGAAGTAGRGAAMPSPFQLAAHGPHGRPPLPPGTAGTAAHGSSADSSPDGLPRGHAPVPPLHLGPGALPPPSPPSAAGASPAPSPPQQSRNVSPEKPVSSGGGASGGGSSSSSPSQAGGKPARQPSLRSSLPTIASQQVFLGDSELPSLPPLHIPLHPMLSLGEEGAPLSAATLAAAGSPRSASQTTTPHAQQAAQQKAVPAAGKMVRISTDSGSSGEAVRDAAALQRQSTSSTIFWMGEAGWCCVRLWDRSLS